MDLSVDSNPVRKVALALINKDNKMEKKLPSDHLEALLRTARKMTPEQLAEQRRSFVYANLKLDGCDVTREMVDKADEEMNNEQEAPVMQFLPSYGGIPLTLTHIKAPHDSCRIKLKYYEPSSDENSKPSDYHRETISLEKGGNVEELQQKLLRLMQDTIRNAIRNENMFSHSINLEPRLPRAVALSYKSDEPGVFYTTKEYDKFTMYEVYYYVDLLYDDQTIETYEHFPTVKTKFLSIPEGKLPFVKFNGKKECVAQEFNIGATAKKESNIISAIKECYDVLEYKIANKIDEDRKCSDVIVTYRGKDLANVFSIHPYEKGYYINGVFSVTTNKTED